MTGTSAPDRVLLGRIVGAHGIRGEVLIHTFTTSPEAIAAYGPLSDAAGTCTFKLTSARETGKGTVARIAGIADRNAAEALKGTELYIARNQLPVAAEGEFYHADLIGLAAILANGTPIGRILAVQNFGAGDLIEIRLAGSDRTELVPFTEDFVPKIDIAAGHVVVVLPVSTEDEESAS